MYDVAITCYLRGDVSKLNIVGKYVKDDIVVSGFEHVMWGSGVSIVGMYIICTSPLGV